MCIENTPLEWYPKFKLHVKREDMCCPGGPNFSKTRGVFAHVKRRNEHVIGVLDTSHSQGGWAVARACQLLGKLCVVYYPEFKKPRGWSNSQVQAKELGATIIGLPAGRSAILYHRAKRDLHYTLNAHDGPGGGYMMPNALKLDESVWETSKEFGMVTDVKQYRTIVVSASSGTIAAGILQGAMAVNWRGEIVVHLGYSRSEGAVRSYLEKMSGYPSLQCTVVDEGYAYSDQSRPGITPPFPCNPWYDLKAFRWLMGQRKARLAAPVLFWNIG